jgi:hypothetical protein
LEAEVVDMEAGLEKSKQCLADEQAKARELEFQIRHRKQLNAAKEAYQAHRPLAQSSQKNMVILKGLHTWKPLSLEESALSFGFIGPSPTSAIKMSFDLSNTGTVGWTSCIIPYQVHHRHRIDRKYHPTVMAFIDAATKKLLGSGSLLSPQKIGFELQQLELDIGRLAQVAHEFESLRRRYNARLSQRDEGTPTFYLTIGFLNQKIRATFDVLESYPATMPPFTIDAIDGEIDVIALQKLITRNVKPGFWSLSRSCDAIVAFLRDRES